MSREPWNTGTGGGAVCEDMPRKSLDIRSADHPPAWERGSCAFPCFRRGRVRAEPGRRVKGRVPCGFSGQRPEPSESLPISISTDFQGSFEPFSLAPVFHRLLDTTALFLGVFIAKLKSVVRINKETNIHYSINLVIFICKIHFLLQIVYFVFDIIL